MSQYIGRFPLTVNIQTSVSLPSTGISAIVVSNDSQYSLSVGLNGTNVNQNIPAGVADIVRVPGNSFTGTLILTPTQELTIQNSPVNVAEITIYGPGEPSPGIYPMSLNRLSNVGNNVGTQQTLLINSTTNVNGSSLSIPGMPVNPTDVCYLVSFDLQITSSGVQAFGNLAVGPFDPSVDPAGVGLNYAIQSFPVGPTFHMDKLFPTPLQGVQGSHINFTFPPLSNALVSLNTFFYLN